MLTRHMIYTCAVVAIYALTIKIGLLGNCWVINSIIRSRRPRSTVSGLSPSDRLRTYIGLLAIVDLLVIFSLIIRFIYAVLPHATLENVTCRIVFVVDHLVKLASLTCLACISIERMITIRKPFSSRVRKRLIQFTPLVAMVVLFSVFSAIGLLAWNINASAGGMDCMHSATPSPFVSVARWIVAASFLTQLGSVSTNYGQIIRHVRRKFWQRKARVVANSKTKQPLVSEPRYMRDMTTAIVRIACFHVICWLPYCLLQLLPEHLEVIDTASIRIVNGHNYEDTMTWVAFVADWLTYVNSAGDWVFYAAMNRDLRSIIRATTERRKRSTLSQQSPSSNLHRSLRRQMAQSLRFFYSINSYRSAANSFDESVSTLKSLPNNGNESPTTKVSCYSYGNGTVREQGIFGMRNGRAHTYCSPRPVITIPHQQKTSTASSILSNGSTLNGILTNGSNSRKTTPNRLETPPQSPATVSKYVSIQIHKPCVP
ncbi:Protein NPR-31, partial [Aphelenchoides avenae]